MRITSLEVSGFRGFSAPCEFDLDASAVILVGANGAGKTSLFDAVLWCLSGSVSRITSAGGDVVSGYSSDEIARVRLLLRDERGETLDVVRTQVRGEESHLLVRDGLDAHRGVVAEAMLLSTIWPEGATAEDSANALEAMVTRSIYLQQDLIREFVEADSEQRRFDVLSELVGIGRIRELQNELEREKRAWSTATNALSREAEPLEARIAELQAWSSRLTERTSGDLDAVSERWLRWWETATAFLGESLPTDVRVEADALRQTDLLLRRLEQERAKDQRWTLAAEQLLSLPEPPAPPTPEEQHAVEARADEAAAGLEMARQLLEVAEKSAAERRAMAVRERELNAQLAAMASLAKDHLGEVCPVCTQPYDRDKTHRHLDELIAASGPVSAEPETGADVQRHSSAVLEAETRLAEARREAAEVHRRAVEADALRRIWSERLAELGVRGARSEIYAEVRAAHARRKSRIAAMQGTLEDGEKLLLTLTTLAEGSRRDEIQAELGRVESELARLRAAVERQAQTGDVAQRLIEGIRSATSDVIGEQLLRLQPLLTRVYARIDPHPVMRDIHLRAWISGGRGRLEQVLSDRSFGFKSPRPATVLSSSQVNALALATFFSLNLGVPKIPLETAMLDDPLQSLDDVNMLGLVDLLRRARARRQLIVSTHDPQFGRLLERKLRPVGGERTVRIDLSGWSRSGPDIVQQDIPGDAGGLRIAAA